MNMKAQKPLTKPQVDLAEQETMQCESCGNYLFITSHILKRLSAIVSPTGLQLNWTVGPI